MLEQEQIEEYSKLVKECENAKQIVQQLNTEIAMIKKQGVEKLKEKGYTSLADASKISEQIEELEKEITEDIPKMRAYISEVNEKKELKERIMMG